MKTAIVTDSNSGITQEEARLSGVFVVPMPVLIDSKQYFEGVTLSQEQFYQKLRDGKVNVSTSQPNPFDVEELWTEILKTHDALVHIPMSSGLSETCSTLSHLAHEKFDKRVFVADNQRISVTQKQSVRDAVKMVAEGKSAEEICSRLVETRAQSSIYIMVDTLKYLKKGGRLTPAAAAIGTLLRIKPILQIQGQKLDKYAKVRRFSDAKKTMLKAIGNDLETRFAELRKQGKLAFFVAHTDNYAAAEQFAQEIREAFPDISVTDCDPLSLSVSCHIGPVLGRIGIVVRIGTAVPMRE